MIDYRDYKESCIAFFQRLVQTPSVNGQENEGAVIEVIAKEAQQLGLPFQTKSKDPQRPNIFVGERFDDNQSLLLVAHIDTVPVGDSNSWESHPFSGSIKENKLFGRGAIDCKGGIAISLYALRILKDLGKLHNAKFVGVADEESGGDSELGLRFLLQQGLKARAAIYTYGGGTRDNLTIGHRGWIRVWIECLGESAHTGSLAWQKRLKGENAIEGIVAVLASVRNLDAPGENKYFPELKFVLTPTIIQGGRAESIVPDEARVLLDMRTLPEHNNHEILKNLTKLIKSLENNKRKFNIEIKNNVSAALTDPKNEFVQRARRLHQEIFVRDPKLVGSGPGNESYMLIKQEIPTIVGYGPLGENSHSPNEYADLDSFKDSLRFLTEIALD